MTRRLHLLLGVSIPLFIIHGLEEWYTRIYETDSHVKFFFDPLANMSVAQATFIVFQISLWIILAISFFLTWNDRWQKRMMVILGFVFIYEIQHPISALMVQGYYPGLYSSLLFPIIGYYYWKELLKK